MLGNNPVMNFFIDVPLKVVKLAVLFSTYGILYLGQLKRPGMTYLIFGRIKFTKFTDFTGGMEMTGMIHWVSFFRLYTMKIVVSFQNVYQTIRQAFPIFLTKLEIATFRSRRDYSSKKSNNF